MIYDNNIVRYANKTLNNNPFLEEINKFSSLYYKNLKQEKEKISIYYQDFRDDLMESI